jgi:flagellar hook-length control protein FliK
VPTVPSSPAFVALATAGTSQAPASAAANGAAPMNHAGSTTAAAKTATTTATATLAASAAPATNDPTAVQSSFDPATSTDATPTDAAPMTVSTVAPPVPVAQPIASAPPAAPVPAPIPLQTQIAGPVFTLAQGTAGEQTITINVTPENLGPVTVIARASAGSMHIELFAPSDSGREALRVLLTDLRRDLAVAGIPTSLSLSTQTGPPTADGTHPGGAQTGVNQRDSGPGAAPQNDSQHNPQHNPQQNTAAQNEHNTNQPPTDTRQSSAEALSDRPAIGSYRSLDVMA